MPTLGKSAPRGLALGFDTLVRPVVPATRLAAIRILTAIFALVYLAIRLPHLWRVNGHGVAHFRPVGLLTLFDAPLSPGLWYALLAATLVLACTFLLGYRHRILAPIFAICLLLVLSYRNSFGMIFHTENLLVLHIAVLALMPAADAWSLDRRGRAHPALESWVYGWAIFLLCAISLTVYALAGIAKLRYGGLSWGSGDVLRNYVAMDNVRKLLLGDTYSPLAAPSMQLGFGFTLLASGSLLLELIAPLCLLSRRLARIWVPSMIGFHVGILALMAIVFPYPMSGIAFVSFYRVEVPLERIGYRLRLLARADADRG